MNEVKRGFSDQLTMLASGVLGRLPGPLQVRLSGRPPVMEGGEVLSPEIQLLLAIAAKRGGQSYHQMSVAKARRVMRRQAVLFSGAAVAVGAVSERSIPTAAGPLKLRHYAPKAARRRPLIVFYHGGGFVMGDLDTHDAPCRILCREADAHVLSVDYRLAPEAPFPAAVDDAWDAFQWAAENADALGADARRLAVAGASAGGNLAAGVAQRAALEGPAKACLQILIYPTTDGSMPYPSFELFGKGFVLSPEDIAWFRGHYSTGASPADPRLSPIRSKDLGKLPPTLVATAAFDLLRDEGEAYAHAVKAAGVRTELIRIPGQVHGFVNMIGYGRASRAAVVRIARAAKTLLDATAP